MISSVQFSSVQNILFEGFFHVTYKYNMGSGDPNGSQNDRGLEPPLFFLVSTWILVTNILVHYTISMYTQFITM